MCRLPRYFRLTPAGEPVPAPGAAGQYLQLVISASHDLLALDKVAIRDKVLAELAEIWPAVNDGQTAEILGRHRTCRNVLGATRCRCASPSAADSHRWVVSRGGLYRH